MNLLRFSVVIAALFALVACEQKPAAPPPVPQSAPNGAGDEALKQGLRALGYAQPAAPAGVPGAAAAGLPMPPPDAGTGAQGVTWTVPASWKAEPPSSAMRKAQYRVAGAAGDAECAVFYFGPGAGGDPKSNAERWVGQFTGPDGAPTKDSRQSQLKTTKGVEVLLVEARGSYAGGMGGGEPRADQMLLGAVASGPDASWFFKLTGPRATVEAQRASFEALLQSITHGG